METPRTNKIINFLKAMKAARGITVRQYDETTLATHMNPENGRMWTRCWVSNFLIPIA